VTDAPLPVTTVDVAPFVAPFVALVAPVVPPPPAPEVSLLEHDDAAAPSSSATNETPTVVTRTNRGEWRNATSERIMEGSRRRRATSSATVGRGYHSDSMSLTPTVS
jgi:hypothetical protein